MTEIEVEEGKFVLDKETDDKDTALVIKKTSANIDEWEVEDGETVADYNPDYSKDQKTVLIVWEDSFEEWDWKEADDLYLDAMNESIRFYAYPINRLIPACRFCGEYEAEHVIYNPNIQTKEDIERKEDGELDATWEVCTGCRDYIQESQQDMARRAIYNSIENMDVDVIEAHMLRCLKCDTEFEKVEDHPGGDLAGVWEPICDCKNLQDIQLSIG